MAAALRPGGRLMALVPAHPGLYGSLDRAYGHERRYTRERLRAITTGAGLTVERLFSFNALGVLGWWARGRTGARGIGSSSLRAYEALLALWRPVERRITLPAGLSLIVHAPPAAGRRRLVVAAAAGAAAPAPMAGIRERSGVPAAVRDPPIPANTDSSRSVSAAPQAGQATITSGLRASSSKRSSHAGQR